MARLTYLDLAMRIDKYGVRLVSMDCVRPLQQLPSFVRLPCRAVATCARHTHTHDPASVSDLSILSSAPAFVTWPTVLSHVVHGRSTCQCHRWVLRIIQRRQICEPTSANSLRNLDFFAEATLIAALELREVRNNKIFQRRQLTHAIWLPNFKNQCIL
jgi:hypothetical protein